MLPRLQGTHRAFAQTLAPRTCKCDLIWRWDPSRGNQVNKAVGGGRGQSGVTCVLVGKGYLDADILRGRMMDRGRRQPSAP